LRCEYNSSLDCIKVFDVSWANSISTMLDPQQYFSLTCP